MTKVHHADYPGHTKKEIANLLKAPIRNYAYHWGPVNCETCLQGRDKPAPAEDGETPVQIAENAGEGSKSPENA